VTLGAAIVVVVLTWRRLVSMAAAIAVLAAWVGELLAVTVTKSVVQRPRPLESLRLVTVRGWSFPSGHTANAVVVFATLAGLLIALTRLSRARTLTWAVAAVLTALVGLSRIELGAHWMTDVVASAVWTACWVLVVVAVFRPQLRSSARSASTNFPPNSFRPAQPGGTRPGSAQFLTPVQSQLGVEVAQVVLDSLRGNEQLGADLGIGEALLDQVGYLGFPGGHVQH
jgi:membrane-associated phospholipid phosphatase